MRDDGAMGRPAIYVEIEIRSSMERDWQLTQGAKPVRHESRV